MKVIKSLVFGLGQLQFKMTKKIAKRSSENLITVERVRIFYQSSIYVIKRTFWKSRLLFFCKKMYIFSSSFLALTITQGNDSDIPTIKVILMLPLFPGPLNVGNYNGMAKSYFFFKVSLIFTSTEYFML